MNKIRNFFSKKDESAEVWGSGGKYYGLVNQGATCYLNSVLQVLYMTPDYRERVTSHAINNPQTEYIDRELSGLFLELKEKLAFTHNITNKLKINNVKKQHDAADLYEKVLRLTSPGASQIFHGKLTNRNTCQNCHSQTETEVGFWHLPLPLSNDDDCSVERGVLDFFRASEISGDDQMYCEKCDEKCDAVLECKVTHAPEVLVLLLKRFEFDHTLGKYIKISNFVDVPLVLNVQNQTYELHALVEHIEEQRFGRYIATIRCQEDRRWYLFEDSNVTVSRNQYFQSFPTERSQTAYLLFYQKRKAKYNGLLNLGATCYLNSVLQVLFMTKDFRESVKNHVRNNPGTEHMDRELSSLFTELEESFAYTYNIIKKLKINNVEEQRDAAEHYEKILRLTSPEASQIFHGELKNTSTCLYCAEKTESTTGFWHLPLSLVEDGCSVHRSLHDFFQQTVQIYCEKCDETRDAIFYCELKNQPEVLVLLIKRFEYDDKHMRNVKNMTAMEVPFTLHMPLTYELYACVEHFGELGYGRYIARIISKDEGRCYIFDDFSVSLQLFQEHLTCYKSQAAYLLFYRKQKDNFSRDDISAPETSQLEDGTAEKSTSDNKEKEEECISDAKVTPEMKEDKSLRASPKFSDETTNTGEAVHEKALGQWSENSRGHREERFEHTESHSNQTCHSDVDKLADCLKEMTITDFKDSIFSQVDDSNQLQELREEEEDTGDDRMDEGGEGIDKWGEETRRSFDSGPSEECFGMKGYRLKRTFQLKDLGSQGKHGKTIHGDCSQARAKDGRSVELNSTPQPYRIHYPDNEEDSKRIEATKRFIKEEQEVHSSPENDFRSLPNMERSEQREPRNDTRRKERASSLSKFDRVESLGVTERGDTEFLVFKPKKRQETGEKKAEHQQHESGISDSSERSESSQDPETRFVTQV